MCSNGNTLLINIIANLGVVKHNDCRLALQDYFDGIVVTMREWIIIDL